MDRGTSTEEGRSISLQIGELNRLSPVLSTTTTPPFRAPEKKLTLFALRLAILEKTATGLGALGFIWATVVLLGGFAITLGKSDFWIVTVILLIEGARIFSRSHELEWQHEATWSVVDAGRNSFRALRSSSRNMFQAVKSMFGPNSKRTQRSRDNTENADGNETRPANFHRLPTRTWKSSDVPLLPYFRWVFLARNISKILYWLQLASATACIVLSVMKLIRRDFGEVEKGDTDKRNRHSALIIFYSLALAEALLFLVEKAYWEWKVTYCKLLEEVNKECDLGVSGIISIRRFFYDAYSRCVNGSIFDGLKMDMVTLAMELLDSDFPDEQLTGARILRQFATNERFSSDTLQKIGINLSVIERLVEMLNWKDPQEEEIRRSAAETLSEVAGKKQNSLRVAGIPGAMESISSLLQTRRTSCVDDEIGKSINLDQVNYGFCTFNHLGLLILKKLARHHDNCGKIGNSRGLLPKIIDFSHGEENLLRSAHPTSSQVLTVKYSLQLVKMLASTTGTTGKLLRKEISEVVFTISNIRNILKHGDKHPILQKLGIQILTSLALEDDARDNIGGTGGILKELFKIFFKEEMPENQNLVRIAAGEALAMLALGSKTNCFRISKLKVVDKLKEALEIPLLRINAAIILRNLCTYTGEDCFNHLRGLETAASIVLKTIILEEHKLQEVMIGLAAHIFKFMSPEEFSIMFESTGVQEVELANALVHVLKKYQQPTIKVPRIRRFAIELAIWMMTDKERNVHIFRQLGLEEELEIVLETTSELENFNIFSGTIGLSRHSTPIHLLVETALKLLQRDDTLQNSIDFPI